MLVVRFECVLRWCVERVGGDGVVIVYVIPVVIADAVNGIPRHISAIGSTIIIISIFIREWTTTNVVFVSAFYDCPGGCIVLGIEFVWTQYLAILAVFGWLPYQSSIDIIHLSSSIILRSIWSKLLL